MTGLCQGKRWNTLGREGEAGLMYDLCVIPGSVNLVVLGMNGSERLESMREHVSSSIGRGEWVI